MRLRFIRVHRFLFFAHWIEALPNELFCILPPNLGGDNFRFCSTLKKNCRTMRRRLRCRALVMYIAASGGVKKELFMIRNRFLSLFVCLAAGLMLVLSPIACGDEDALENMASGDGWPPASERAKVGLAAWNTPPAGISGITWVLTDLYGQLKLGINFSAATGATAGDIDTFLTGALGGYVFAAGSPLSTGPHQYSSHFEKASTPQDFVASYTFAVPGGGGILIQRNPDSSSSSSGGGLAGNFDIPGCTLPVAEAGDTLVFAHTGNPASVADWWVIFSTYSGTGWLSAPAKVYWVIPPSAGTYTILLMDSPTSKHYKATSVPITAGGSGSVSWSAFTLLPET
jgi:hypothetical protein